MSQILNHSSANPTKWSNTLKQFVGFCRQIFLVFDHFVGLTLKTDSANISSTKPTEVIFRYLFFDLHFKANKRMNLFNLSRNNTPILELVNVRYSLRRLRSQEVDIDFRHLHS